MKAILIVFCFLANFGFGQQDNSDSKKTVRSGKIESSDGASYIFENDRNGNQIFSRNVGMNGPITMMFVSDYDSLGRETISYSVHSNLGFSVYETEYQDNSIFNFSYSSLSEDKTSYDQESLEEVKTKSDFLALPVIHNLKSGIRRLTSIEVLNSDGNVTENLNISKEEDTTSVNITEYDPEGRKLVFHYGVDATDSWSWDIYYVHDDSSNMVQSFRISQPNKGADTTEVYNYKFDKTNRLISKDYYYRKTFKSRTDYEFLKHGGHIEYFYEGSESEIKVKTIYKYNRFGFLQKKIKWDYRNPKKEQKTVTSYTLLYW